MLRKLKTIFTAAVMLIALTTPALLAEPAYASSTLFNSAKGEACQGIDVGSGTNACQADAGDINHTLAVIINVLSLIVGIAAVIMLIIGGLMFITSGGSSESIGTAKRTIIYALVGLAVTAMAEVLVHFVLTKTG